MRKLLTDEVRLRAVARNYKEGDKLKAIIKLIDKDGKEHIKEGIPIEVDSKNVVRTEKFTTESMAEELKINPNDIVEVRGWIDEDGNGKYDRDYEEESVFQIEKFAEIVGIGHIERTNESYLITVDDLKELEELSKKGKNSMTKTKEKIDDIKSKMRKNPINEFGNEVLPDDNILNNFARGFLSVGGYLYAFGDFIGRYSGFRDYQECNSSVIEDLECNYEKDKLNQDIIFTKKLTQAIATNERGLGEYFIKSIKKHITQNKAYFGGRMVGTGVIAGRVTDKRINIEMKIFGEKKNLKINPVGLPISSFGSFMDILYYVRNVNTSVTIEEVTSEIVDLYAKYIVLGQ